MTYGGAECTACGAPIEAEQQFCTRCGAPAPPQPSDSLRDRLQDLLGAELELQDEVGRGGMAVVFAARDPLLERRVAVKALLPEFAHDTEMADRFLREARTAAQLQHPNIVSVFGARSRGDLLVMLMAFVEGRSVDAVLQEQGRLPLHVAGRLAADMASALQYAHERKVIHRDVKPANVLLASNGGALVSDFGIARRQDVPGMTGEGMLLGSLAYMSPEQRYAEALTGATDQYALAVSAFEMLAGRKPFEGTVMEMHVGHLERKPPSVREFRVDVPPDIARAIDRMLAKKPGDRFPDLREPKRIFERMVTDARSVSAEIAKLSGVLVAPTASRVISAVRKAPTMPIAAPVVPPKAGATVSVEATRVSRADATPTVVARPVQVTSVRASRAPIYGAVALAVLIVGGAVVIKARRSAPLAGAAQIAPAVESARDAQSANVAPAGATAAPQQANTTPSNTTSSNSTSAPRAGAAGDAAPRDASVRSAPAGVPLAAATLQPRTQQPSSSPASPAATPAAAPASSTEPPRAAPSQPAASVADARVAARALVTIMNQRRARDLERLADAGGGDAAARRVLERLIRDHTDFQTGFEVMPSAPEAEGEAFITEFTINPEWGGGNALFDVRLRLVRQGDAWVPAAYSVKAR